MDRGFGFYILLLTYQRRFGDAEKMVHESLAQHQITPLFTAISRASLGQLRLAQNDRPGAEALFLQDENELNELRRGGEDGTLLKEILLIVEAHLGHRAAAQEISDSLLETTKTDRWQFPREQEQAARACVIPGDFDRALPLIEQALSAPAVEALTPAFLFSSGQWSQKFQHRLGVLAAFLRMRDERNLMRPGHVHDVRKGRDRCFHNIEFAEHRRGKDVQPRVVLEQELRDIPPPHVRRAAQRRLEIAFAPVDRTVNQPRLFCQHLLHRLEIGVARDHEPFRPRPI